MDLSHLVTIGLFAAKRKPLNTEDLEYFRKHKVDEKLADVVEQLAQLKPDDPFKFIAEALAGLKTAPSAPTTKADAAPKKAKDSGKAAATAPSAAAPAQKPAPAPVSSGGAVDEAAIKAVGDEIRDLKAKLKSEGMSGKQVNEHADIKQLVAKLTELKAGSAAETPTATPAPAKAAQPAKAEKKQEEPKKEKAEKAKKGAAAETALVKQPAKGGGVQIKKMEDTPGWYEQVIMKGELIEQYPVKGCFILRQWAYRIWELVQGWFDKEIKLIGVENCYFPMFIPKCYIEKEEDHLNDFAPELAWVSKFGNQDIDEPVAIRPTSETAMYAAFSNWVQSHRDLPIRLNQWCSVVRWEVKQTTPFLRTREFLWQEGHTAHADKAGAEKEVLDILELYAGIYEKLMSIPVVRGTKTKAETFPGADYTTTVEAFIPATGRAIQGATSHHLGQNFSKMFDISFQDPKDPDGKKRENAYQNSWGVTQRTLGVMVMVHGDDRGLVLPPRVASLQVVIVVVGIKAATSQQDRDQTNAAAEDMYEKLTEAGIRAKVDDRDNSPGWKFNFWEMKGVPVRIELGPLDIKKGEFVMAKRNAEPTPKAKVTGKIASVVDDVNRTLDSVQSELYDKALAERDERLVSIDEWKDFSPNLNQGKLLLVPFCGDPECEEAIKNKSKEEAADVEVAGGLKMGAKSLCVPHEDKYNKACPSTCINPDCVSANKNEVTRRTLFGRSY
mmetsp:Transcript_93708/g.264498  ORF Transcript_93708/g.264498 Transcript_93708/m.264498 type:complete len:725 (-) Transcript_93708:109-2283(-)